jgi:hypothetical protein
VVDQGLGETRSEGWATSARTLATLGPFEVRASGEGREMVLLGLAGALVQVNLWSGHVQASAAANDAAAVEAAFVRLRELLPAPDPSSTHEVTVTFWTYGPQGPMPSWRSIAVPSWEEIHGNYSAEPRAALEQLMTGFRPAHGGQLILWHGRAGTGKTFALRSLAWEWRDWCDFHYIVDPDTFFGQHADYLMSVLLQPEYMAMTMASPHGFIARGMRSEGDAMTEDLEEGDQRRANSWRVLILEDTGELLAADARVAIGQGLSRFLNVVDGLIGQGLRVIVLVTTNEEIRKLHPAVARPGRSAAKVEFLPLTQEEASTWLHEHGVDEPAEAQTSLASLYAKAHDFAGVDNQPATGFAS